MALMPGSAPRAPFTLPEGNQHGRTRGLKHKGPAPGVRGKLRAGETTLSPAKIDLATSVCRWWRQMTAYYSSKLFRTWGWTIALIVSEGIKKALGRSKATGTTLGMYSSPLIWPTSSSTRTSICRSTGSLAYASFSPRSSIFATTFSSASRSWLRSSAISCTLPRATWKTMPNGSLFRISTLQTSSFSEQQESLNSQSDLRNSTKPFRLCAKRSRTSAPTYSHKLPRARMRFRNNYKRSLRRLQYRL